MTATTEMTGTTGTTLSVDAEAGSLDAMAADVIGLAHLCHPHHHQAGAAGTVAATEEIEVVTEAATEAATEVATAPVSVARLGMTSTSQAISAAAVATTTAAVEEDAMRVDETTTALAGAHAAGRLHGRGRARPPTRAPTLARLGHGHGQDQCLARAQGPLPVDPREPALLPGAMAVVGAARPLPSVVGTPPPQVGRGAVPVVRVGPVAEAGALVDARHLHRLPARLGTRGALAVAARARHRGGPMDVPHAAVAMAVGEAQA